ncbi:hypothetical protein Golob_025282 [Gossypium lobatum]|uniref:RNase H type-1 domain-containing protein n=1 Tax=Gossypium lobatum TaxID=34289 RepID=A0A7J8NG67_9ROSI|nr:hypothetical protein [Gossypium lobatum]
MISNKAVVVVKIIWFFRKFDSVQINWIDRCSNKAADLLCNLAIKKKCNLYFNTDYPVEIHNIVINDAIK